MGTMVAANIARFAGPHIILLKSWADFGMHEVERRMFQPPTD